MDVGEISVVNRHRNKEDMCKKRAFTVAALRLWNSLPDDVKHATSLAVFKKKL